MTKAHAEVVSAALALPEDARAGLAEELLNSLRDTDHQEIDAAWASEAERRIDEMDAGKSELLPGETVMEKLQERAQ